MLYSSIVTTGQKDTPETLAEGRQVAALLQIPFIARNKKSLNSLANEYGFKTAIIWTKKGPLLVNERGQQHYFHLSMAQLRLVKIARGEEDPLVKAVGNEDIESFLDCTLGLGSDSLVVSFAKPSINRFVGVEGMPELAFITNFGLRHFEHENPKVTEALRKIQVCAVDHYEYLRTLPNSSVDVIYFDPMFTRPVEESPQFQTLRGYNWDNDLNEVVFAEAVRVARKRIIVKARKTENAFNNIPIHYEVGGKYSRVIYGVYEIDG